MNFNATQRALIAELVVRAIIDSATALDNLSAEKNPHSYPRERERLTELAAILTALRDATGAARAISDLEQWAARDGNEIQGAMYDAQRAEGINPAAELLDIDPRALNPKCVHGVPFAEACSACGV